MDLKKVVVLSLGLSMLLLTLTYGTVARATPEERRTVYSMDFLGLKVTVEAPYQANPSENITITVRAESSGNVYVEYIYVNIYGLRNETEEIQLAGFPCVEKSDLTVPRKVDYVVTIPNNTSPGLLYGIMRMEVEKDVSGMVMKIRSPPAGFVVTYVKNLEFEELQAAYEELNATYNLKLEELREAHDELNATYNSLLENYTRLDSKYAGELGGARNLMYVFAGTTLVSAATAAILFLRRPKKLTW